MWCPVYAIGVGSLRLSEQEAKVVGLLWHGFRVKGLTILVYSSFWSSLRQWPQGGGSVEYTSNVRKDVDMLTTLMSSKQKEAYLVWVWWGLCEPSVFLVVDSKYDCPAIHPTMYHHIHVHADRLDECVYLLVPQVYKYVHVHHYITCTLSPKWFS